MSEQRVRDFGTHAEQLVRLPELEDLEDRGARLRRRRQAVSASLVAVVIGLVAWASTTTPQTRTDPGPAHVDDRLLHATAYHGFGSRPELEPGTYYWRVSKYADGPLALVTLPSGWHAWDLGPNRWFHMDGPKSRPGYAGLIVTELYDLVEQPCTSTGMRQLGGEAPKLVAAFRSLVRHRVVAGPVPDDRFGLPSTYLGLETRHATCPGHQSFDLTTDTGIGTPIWSAGPGSRVDVWVVDTGGRPVVVMATWDPTSPRWLVRQLHDVADTVRLVDQPSAPRS
jgi:hypothetical protein